MSGLTATYQDYVMPSMCDHLDHMNVQYYFAAVSDGMFAFQTKFGLGPKAVKERGLSFAVVRAETDFRSELSAGDVIRLDSGLLEIGSKSATFLHRLVRIEDESLAMQTKFKAVLFDLNARRAAEIPDDIRKAMAPFVVDEADS